jgi:hypothetical protein
MQEAKSSPGHSGLFRILGGIEIGVIGGVWMLLLLIIGSLWQKHPWWTIPNLLGSTFYGDYALQVGVGKVTLAGGAFHLVACGLLGVVFAIIFGGVRPTARLVLVGAFVGVGWYFISHGWVWRRVNPLIPLYSPQPSTILAHLLLGLSFGRFHRFQSPPARAPVGLLEAPADAAPTEQAETESPPTATADPASPAPSRGSEQQLVE